MSIWLVFVLTCLLGMWFSIRRPEGILSLGFIASVVFLGFWSPQFYYQLENRLLPQAGLEKMIIMANLCLIAIIVGYHIGSRPSFKIQAMPFANSDVFWSGVVIALIGALALFGLSRLPEEIRNQRSPTGALTAYAFLVKAVGIAFAFAVMGWVRHRGTRELGLACLTGLFMAYRIFVVAKRTAVLEAALVVFGAFWFIRKKRPPTWIGLFALPTIAVLLTTGHAYRKAMSEGAGQWAAHEVSAQRISGAASTAYETLEMDDALRRVAYNETLNGVMNIEAKSRTRNFNYGLADIVSITRIVLPQQIFGDLRDDLIGWYRPSNDAYMQFGFRPKLGTPRTGIATAYEAFWYFGCLLFFAYSFLVGRVHYHARGGNVFAQGIWPHAIFAILNMVSHNSNRFPMAIVRIFILVIPAIILVNHLSGTKARR